MSNRGLLPPGKEHDLRNRDCPMNRTTNLGISDPDYEPCTCPLPRGRIGPDNRCQCRYCTRIREGT